MSDATKIQWTDHTFNPWIGCAKVHAGCTNCYAEADFDRRRHVAEWGPNGTRVLTSEGNWKKPFKWNRDAERDGIRRKVFCSSLADVFEDRPELVEWRRRLFALIYLTEHLDWQLLTKRPENIQRMWIDPYPCMTDFNYRRRQNVWLGTSVSDQATANKAIPELLACRDLAPVLFLSAEPLLGPINLEMIRDPKRFPYAAHFDVLRGRMIHEDDDFQWTREPNVDWLIVGGESGPNARPNNVEWTESIIAQCRDAGVPCFHKQLGSRPVRVVNETTKHLIIQDRKGGDPSEWPEALRVRQFPAVAQ